MQYEYFYGAQAEQFSFYRIPKALFTEPKFRELSTDAKVLYCPYPAGLPRPHGGL